jgi:hypothetical protein
MDGKSSPSRMLVSEAILSRKRAGSQPLGIPAAAPRPFGRGAAGVGV